ncbi:hypothetical protein AG1IA_06808 [Rhizoctonia solani AG-1 IA]|uniref:Uncharacterized protein n=1 Tax=Thanatephorus cucumeris (strain AG1-IA) TaxID=983506 RepID=L8WS01_THACA|nr:hypothetical protein AG1IA_06808 [Rhizoctonia solani AG-1 IA]
MGQWSHVLMGGASLSPFRLRFINKGKIDIGSSHVTWHKIWATAAFENRIFCEASDGTFALADSPPLLHWA